MVKLVRDSVEEKGRDGKAQFGTAHESIWTDASGNELARMAFDLRRMWIPGFYNPGGTPGKSLTGSC
jgi:hypothetical protein